MGFKLTVTTALTFEPVSVPEMKRYLRVTSSSEDDLIKNLIRYAREYCERFTEKQIVQCSYQLSVDYFPIYMVSGIFSLAQYQTIPNNMLIGSSYNQDINYGVLTPFDARRVTLPNLGNFTLPKPPLISVQSVQYLDLSGTLQTVDPADYSICTTNTPGYIKTVAGWPNSQQNTTDSVMVNFTCGYASAALIPEIYKMAIYQMVSFYFENRVPMIGADAAITQAVDRILAPEKQYSTV